MKGSDIIGIPVVIGGIVMDIHATPSIPPNPRSTTPGKVAYVFGGVARNVADCMMKLGMKSFMISAVGLDMAGNLLLEQWKSAGLPIDGIKCGVDIRTATVLNMFDINGELVAGIASVESIERCLTPEWIQEFRSNVCSAPVLMVDSNLSPHALEASCKMAAEFDIPLWFEPVSVAKSRRVVSIAKYVRFASPNEQELVAMANTLSGRNLFQPIPDIQRCSKESLFQMLKPAIQVLFDHGIMVVLVTLGPKGVLLCFRTGQGSTTMSAHFNSTKSHGVGKKLYETVNSRCPADRYSSLMGYNIGSSHLLMMHFPALPASVVRVSGAGDCLVGGVLASLCSGLNIMQSVAVGVAAAKASIIVESNVPSEFKLAAIADDAGLVYSSAKVVSQESRL